MQALFGQDAAPGPARAAAYAAAPDDDELRRAADGLLWRAALGGAAALVIAFAMCTACFPLLLAAPIVYVIGELVFAALYIQKYQILSSSAVAAPQRPLDYCPLEFFEKATEHLKQFEDVRAFLSLWFRDAPFSELRRGNVAELLAYAFFYKTVDDVERDGQGCDLEAMVARLEEIWHLEIEEGYNPSLKFMGHLWEPLTHMWRPLGFYLSMEAAALLRDASLRAMGFRRGDCMGLTYYSRPGTAAAAGTGANVAGAAAGGAGAGEGGGAEARQQQGEEEQGEDVPLLLLHGVGMGLLPYITFLANLAATGRTVIAVEFKHIAMRWCNWIPSVDETARAVDGILSQEGAAAACVVAHSYGTAVASRLLQSRPDRVAHLCLIDPVCFAMFMPNLLRNFLYNPPGTGSAVADFAMTSAARELHVSASLSRRFLWTDVILWEDQLPQGTLVALAGRDVLMATQEVRRWLEWHTEAEVMTHPSLAHAEFLLHPLWQRQIVLRALPLQTAAVRALLARRAAAGWGGANGAGALGASRPGSARTGSGGSTPRGRYSERCLGGCAAANRSGYGKEGVPAGEGSRRGSVQPLFPVGVPQSHAVLHGIDSSTSTSAASSPPPSPPPSGLTSPLCAASPPTSPAAAPASARRRPRAPPSPLDAPPAAAGGVRADVLRPRASPASAKGLLPRARVVQSNGAGGAADGGALKGVRVSLSASSFAWG